MQQMLKGLILLSFLLANVAMADCPEANADMCEALSERIRDLSSRRALARGEERVEITFELDQAIEIRAALRSGETLAEALPAIERKYRLLREIRAAQTELEAEADALPYHPLELEATLAVAKRYGRLRVKPGTEELRLSELPWAAYWLPLVDDWSFAHRDSPFAKLDRVLERLGRASGIVAWEKNRHGTIPAYPWEGYCEAWAKAATLVPEPRKSLVYQGETFTPADLKALLVRAYELYPTDQWGVRYSGDFATDGTYQDLRPEAFHLLATRTLAQGRPLLLDEDAGVEVWTKPLFRFRYEIVDDPQFPDAFLVKAFPWFIQHRRMIDGSPTGSGDIKIGYYEYRLHVDRSARTQDGYLVIAGEWLGDSRRSHPDFVVEPLADGSPKSSNEPFDRSLGVLFDILRHGVPE